MNKRNFLQVTAALSASAFVSAKATAQAIQFTHDEHCWTWRMDETGVWRQLDGDMLSERLAAAFCVDDEFSTVKVFKARCP